MVAFLVAAVATASAFYFINLFYRLVSKKRLKNAFIITS